MKNVFVFLGSEPLIIKNKIDNIIKNSGCNDFNINVYNLEDVNVSAAIEDALMAPFMANSKVVILKNPLFLTKQKLEIHHNTNMFLEYIKNPLETTILIIDATGLNLDDSKEYVKVLLKVGEISKTTELTQIEQEGWLKRQFALEGVEIKDDAVKLFLSKTGKDLVSAKSEVNKLINYVAPQKIVTIKDVNLVTTKEIETEIFSLSNAIIERNTEKMIRIYNDLTGSGKDATQLLGMISKSMTFLFAVSTMLDNGYKQNEISQILNISSGRTFYLIKNVRSFSKEAIETSIGKLGDLDYKIKSGIIDAPTGLEIYLFSV